MVNVRIIYRPDGQVSVIHLIEKARRKDETDKQMFNRVQAKIPDLKDLSYDDMDISTLPVRDENRYKWRGSKGQGVHIDNTVIKEKTEAELLEERLKALEERL